jgi:tRNA dimethylallyltransferase
MTGEASDRKHLALVGPTASGKSSLAFALAQARPDVELVSVDSMQVYRGMDIGTAKPTPADQQRVAHHLIDVADPAERFTVARFSQEAQRAIAEIEVRGHTAILVGGTGMYLQAVIGDLNPPGEWPDVRDELQSLPADALYARLEQSDPLAASRIERGNVRRLQRALEVTIGSGRPFSSFGPGVGAYPPTSRFQLVAVWLPRAVLRERIDARVEAMFAAGLVDEVRALAPRMGKTACQALGYKEILADPGGDDPGCEDAKGEIKRRTREFGRRQRAWLRRDPRLRWHGTARDPERLLPGLARELDACRRSAEM